MKIPIPEIVIVLLVALALIFVESGGIAGMTGIGATSGNRITGSWTSYSPTRFGARTVEFFANGTCRIGTGADAAQSCKWNAQENGRFRIDARVAAGDETFSADLAGDSLVVLEAGRETHYVRTHSTEAYGREQLVKGPGTFSIPWFFESGK